MILQTGPVTDAEIAAADLKAYAHNLARVGGEACCLAIEEAWGLAGFPPEIVSGVLAVWYSSVTGFPAKAMLRRSRPMPRHARLARVRRPAPAWAGQVPSRPAPVP